MAVLKTGRALYCRLVSWVKFAVGTRTKTNWEVRKGLDSNPGTTQCRIPKIRRDKAVGGGGARKAPGCFFPKLLFCFQTRGRGIMTIIQEKAKSASPDKEAG